MRALSMVFLLLTVNLAFAEEFVPSIAVDNARSIADRDRRELAVFFIPAGTTLQSILPQVTKNLKRAAADKAYLTVLGPDYVLNAKILKAAIQSADKDSLKGATVIVVNGGEDIEDLKNAGARSGVTVRAKKYSHPTVSWMDSQFCARTDRSELELGNCLHDQANLAEQELNETYKRLMARLSVDEQNAPRRDERSWIKWREAECAKQAKNVEECVNGCGVPWTMHVICMTREANNRVDELKEKWSK